MIDKSVTILTMKRYFDAKAERVFEAWINPEIIRKWLFTSAETNKVVKNEPYVGGTWEIVDHREGTDNRAIGEYMQIVQPNKLVFTFKMPQFSELEDSITVEFDQFENGSEMKFTQKINVPHEEDWTAEDIQKAIAEAKDETEQGFSLMFDNLKAIVQGIY
ncbi:SRPBCC family protein [Virgibacillus oceani]|uniref:Activator of Hsp90 ATPase homologue 1/2-like C-terminal domain-containing protein n=1 Tax=Virgibacillus oceani TaxID=1479511 RepID=A0A917HI09_9BACI|nr:SRPBCC domain-containing protein [Virgibacillus oceani]GGG79247.1 hypothetical protein GCM10011398_25700 [Virgibacillus oceani]